MDTTTLLTLLESWELHLRAERKSPKTVKTYGDGVRAFARWADRTGAPPLLDRPTVNAFISDTIDTGAEGNTVKARYASVRRLSKWLADEGEIERDELVGLKPPKVDVKVIPELSVDQVKALIKACAGRDLRDRRDEAVVRLMVESMLRAGEVVAMEVADVDLRAGEAVVQRGKGGKGRRISFGPQTGRAIDRYMRARRSHRLAGTPPLWLGEAGRGFSYWGLYTTLKGRAAAAGLPDDFTPHWLRHTGAGWWLDKGGSEQGLMAVAGWSSRDMIDRYTRATSERRAVEEAKRLGLGDL